MTNLSDEQPNAMPAGVDAENLLAELIAGIGYPVGMGVAPDGGTVKRIVAALAAAGYVVVPMEPTEETVNVMFDAAGEFTGNSINGPDGLYACIYRALTATQPPTPPASRYIGLEKGEAGK